MKKMLLVLFVVVASTSLFAQIASNGTGGGAWNNTTTWSGGLVPDGSGTITIASTDSVYVDIPVTITGTLVNNKGFGVGPGGSLIFANGSIYQHATATSYANNLYPSVFPTATWQPGSTCLVTGVVSIAPLNGNQNFANFTWDCTGQTASVNLGWSGNTIGGNITCNNTGASQFRWTNNTANGSNPVTIIVNGNIVINNAAIMSTTSSGAALVYTITQTGNITVNGTGQLYVCGTSNAGAFVTWSVTGDITTSSGALLRSSNTISRWKFNSTGTQNVNIGATGVVAAGVIFEVANGSTVQLNSPFTINRLVLTSGKINSSTTNILSIGSVNSVTGGSSTAYVEGPMIRTNIVTTSTAMSFPIAKGGIYSPLTLTVTQSATTSTTYKAEMFNATPTTRNLPVTIDKVSTVRYYTLSKSTGSSVTTSSILLNYDNEGIADNTNLRIAKDDGAGNWVDLGGVGTANTTGTITSVNNFTIFGDFVLANNTGGANALPVELTSFTAIAKGRGVELGWKTATEVNNAGFAIEQKGINDSWNKIGYVEGAGTTNTPKRYSYSVTVPVSGKYAFRLKQIDRDGKFEYSPVVEASIALTAQDYSLTQNYPNPFNPSTTFSFAMKNAEQTTVKVFNLVGQEVATLFNGVAQPNQIYTMKFDGKDLSSGIYFYSLRSGSRNEVKKMMLMK